MNILKYLQREKKNLFHFYIISGNSEKNKKDVLNFLENDFGFKTLGNPDFYQFSGLNLPISDSRKIKSINSRTKNNETSFRIFIIDVKKIDREAQNALLKTLEEPSSNTIFFLFLPTIDFVLDTVLSRARVIEGYQNNGSKRASDFLKMTFLEREKVITKISKSFEGPVDLRNEYLSFLVELEIEILENKKSFLILLGQEEFSQMYKRFLEMKKQANQRGSNLKYIMTFLAIDIINLK